MSDNQSWYARKLGQAQPAQQPQQRQNYPAAAPPQPPQWQPPYQPGQPYQATQQQVSPAPPPGNLSEAMAQAKAGVLVSHGGAAVQAGENHRCPSCGSDHFFSRAGMGSVTTRNGMVPPAPICDSCGYNGRFEQFGSKEVG